MKQFFKYVFATIIGLSLFWVLAVLIVVIIAASASGDSEPHVSDNSVLKLKLDEPIMERGRENPFGDLDIPGQPEANFGLLDIRKAIKAAKTDPKIKGIYLENESIQAGFSSVEEIREALLDFKKSGKFIVAYAEMYSEGAYYLASVADSVFLNPVGELEFNGLTSTTPYFKGTLAKLEIEPYIFKVGEYKSAVEPFFLDKMSPAAREQSVSFMNSIYNHLLGKISVSRKLDVTYLKSVSDSMKVQSATDALSYKLVDKLGYFDEVLDLLKSKSGIDKDEKVEFVSIKKYIKVASMNEEKSGSDKIAVIFASGEIQGSEADDDNIGSDEIAEQIRKARLDKKVKAVVLRVNSPGGSALASDVMWREVILCKKEKPIIASMSDVAASGGYYISMGCDSIVAEPTTITGSIGVFGVLFNAKAMFNNKLGTTFDNVSTGQFSDLGSGIRPLKDYEKRSIQKAIEKIYDDFTSKAAQGRRMPVENLRKIASGRVWSGLEAKERGLVDELGGLDKAISIAASKAKLTEGKYRLKLMPDQKNFVEKIMSSLNADAEARIAKAYLGDYYPMVTTMKSIKRYEGIQALMPFSVGF